MKKKNRIRKVSFRINGKSLYLDRYFFDALALADFGELYESEPVKKEVRRKIRELMKGATDLHPQMFYRQILSTFLPPSARKQLNNPDGATL